MATPQDAMQTQINRRRWSAPTEVERFRAASGWIDWSERALVPRLTEEYAGGAVLDIGIGGGRTVPLLTARTKEYVGIDFVPELVEAARRRFPGFDIRDGDARALEFPDASFDIVFFSINGIDAISHVDRATALREIRRVLKPSGTFLYSTHNYDGPGRHERPSSPPPGSWRHPRSSALAVVRRVTHHRQAVANYRELRRHATSGPGWEVTTSGDHDFGILVHYVSPSLAVDELRSAGFAGPVELWDDVEGTQITNDPQRLRRAWYLNIVARCSER
jgi:ubiquinone/menaquinone biosynthesis C-methylase UbiE